MVLPGAGIQRAREGKATFGTPDLEKIQDHCDPHRMQYKQTSPTLLSPTISHAPLFSFCRVLLVPVVFLAPLAHLYVFRDLRVSPWAWGECWERKVGGRAGGW